MKGLLLSVSWVSSYSASQELQSNALQRLSLRETLASRFCSEPGQFVRDVLLRCVVKDSNSGCLLVVYFSKVCLGASPRGPPLHCERVM